MNSDFLDQLADVDVPPPPAEFGQELHVRVNRTLTYLQLIEFACAALPWALWELGRALAGWARFTLSGKYDWNRKKRTL